jgi:hypothetical protein
MTRCRGTRTPHCILRREQAGIALRLALAVALAAAASAYAAQSDPLPVAGWLERVRLSPGEIVLEAKLDSGAYTSSLNAANVQRFMRDGKEWVAFDVVGHDERKTRIERPLVRIAVVKSALGVDRERPTVTLGICIGSVYRLSEVNLVDRSDLSKPMLIGRRFLRGRLLVDLKHRYLLEPTCKKRKVS